jgi:diguanylate cyclase (GGDEF)-like protein/PAS domain S-box-containing protein
VAQCEITWRQRRAWDLLGLFGLRAEPSRRENDPGETLGPAVIPLRQSAVESALKNEAFDHFPSPSVCLNASAQVLAVNRACARLLAVDASDLIGRNISELIALPRHTVFLRRWSRMWARLVERRALVQRTRIGLPGGRRVTLDVSASLLRSEDEPIAVLALREVDADAGSRLWAARAAALGDGVAESTMLLAPDRRVLVTRGRIRHLLGVNAAGAAGVPFEYLVDEPTARDFLAAFERLAGEPTRASVVVAGAARAFSGQASPRRLSITLVNFLGYPRVNGVLARVREIDEHITLRDRADRLQERLSGYAEHITDLTMLTDAMGMVAYQSPAVHALLGRAPKDTLGKPAANLFIDEDRGGFARALRAAVDATEGDRRRNYLARARDADGAMHTLWVSMRNCLDDPQLGGMVVTASDVSTLIAEAGPDARQARQLELRDRLLHLAIQSRADFVQSLSGVLRSSADALRVATAGFWRLDRTTETLVCESVYSRTEQRFLRDWIGADFPATGVVDKAERLRERTPLAIADTAPGPAAGEDGRDPRWAGVRAFLSAPVLLEGEVIGVVGVTDIVPRRWEDDEVGFIATAALMVALAVEAAQRVEAEGRIEQLAWYDPLTGLPNRNLLRENLRDALLTAGGRKRRLAVLLIDLDRFKDVNDTLGHLVGDSLIKSAAEVLREGVGSMGTVARLGGDEFVVLVEDFTHRQEIAELAARLAQAMHRSDFVPNVVTQVSASIGVALFPEHGREIGTLLKNADAAMYQAKRDGRNQVSFFNPIRYERAAREVRMGIELMKAVQEETAQFFIEYQPQVEIVSGRVIGLEALIRWRHPVHGILTPDRFIDVAEINGLSERITRWVVHEVCGQILRWRQVRPTFDIPISINVAGRELGSNVLPILVRSALSRFQIDPRMIALEVTERTLVKDGEINNDVVNELTALGVGLVLDDFGTGYSTLNYLRRLPIRAIKIDRSFIQGIPDDPDNCALVKAMVSVANHFQLAVVAEGVENATQGAYLRTLGCEFAQGHYYSRALPSSKIVEQLSSSKA